MPHKDELLLTPDRLASSALFLSAYMRCSSSNPQRGEGIRKKEIPAGGNVCHSLNADIVATQFEVTKCDLNHEEIYRTRLRQGYGAVVR